MRRTHLSCTALSLVLFALIFALCAAPTFAAFNFQIPTEWTVGAAGSTMNHWRATQTAPFFNSNSLPTTTNVNPTLTVGTSSNMSVESPGSQAGSGGYYSFIDDYAISADVYNHGGSAATTSNYLTGYGTKVRIQTSSTTNPDSDASVIQNTMRLETLDGSPIAGGSSAELLGVTQLFFEPAETPGFGTTDRQELLFEFYLPDYSGDFRVRFGLYIHSSFQDLRVDTMLVEQSSLPGDFDGDNDVDGDDLADWQTGYNVGEYSGRDFLLWQQNFTGPGTLISAFRLPPSPLPLPPSPLAYNVPEPTSLTVVIFGIIIGLPCRAKFGNR